MVTFNIWTSELSASRLFRPEPLDGTLQGPNNVLLWLQIILNPYVNQAYTDEDGRLRTVHPSICLCGQRTEIWAQTVHGQIRTLDQDNNFKAD